MGAACTLATRTLWSGTDELAEYGGAGSLLRRVIPGPGIDDRVATIEASGAVRYFHTDRLGSVVALTDGAGAVTDTYSYSPWGESDAALAGNPWRYTARYLDAETGLYYYRARYYSPRLGQFLQTDPVAYEIDPNLYAYVSYDPLNKIDPSGADYRGGCVGGGELGSPGCVPLLQTGSEGESAGNIWDRIFRQGEGRYSNANPVSAGPHGGNMQRFAGALEMVAGVEGQAADDVYANGVVGAASEGNLTGVVLGVALFAIPGRAGKIECHHCVPRAILRELSPAVRRAVNTRANLLPLPFARHRGAGTGLHSQGYDRRWRQVVAAAGGARNLTTEEVLAIDRKIRAEFGLPPRP